ncbi:hypothetical protein PLIIFM63780_010487 [Purpureocillium lilacinum]|nr:hypothetical protein PLIIFM63780_010487 [Purpureocillium lilacinum]
MTKAHAAPRTKKSRSSTPEYRADGAKHEPKGACKLRNLPIHSIPQAVCDAAVAYFMTSYIVATPFEAYLPGFFISECFHDNPCLFEAVVFQGGQAPTNWTAHTFGAMQLLRLRGKGQFKSPVSQKLYAQASNNIKTSCIQKSVPLPADFVAFNKEVGGLLDPADPAIQLAPVVDRVAHIKAQSLVKADAKLVREAWLLDCEIADFGRKLSAKMQYTTHEDLPPITGAWLDFAHEYPNLRAAKVWNALRLLRQFLVSFISNVASEEVDRDEASFASTNLASLDNTSWKALSRYAMDNMDDISAQILASVPSFLESCPTERRFFPAARSLVWPLSIIETSSICSEPYRVMAAAYLQELARDLNMPQAVRPDRDPGCEDDWLHLFHLG